MLTDFCRFTAPRGRWLWEGHHNNLLQHKMTFQDKPETCGIEVMDTFMLRSCDIDVMTRIDQY